MQTGVAIELKQVTKKYKQTMIIDEMNLQVHPGEFLVLLGPSGCGKSTTLRMIAGLESITSGELLFDGQDATQWPSGKRHIAMVFQDYALYPNMTVRQNIEYAARVHRQPAAARDERTETILTALNLTKYAKRLPVQLSGGQKQRVALGRGMAKNSKLFLLDEPLSNIDVQLREQARDGILRLHEQSQQTVIYVTHDQLEAMALGDRIAVINDGKIQMVDTPDAIYHQPANLFVATFIGSPQINLFTVARQGNLLISNGVPVAKVPVHVHTRVGDGDYQLGIRSEHVEWHTDRPSALALEATVTAVTDYGRFTQLTLKLAADQTVKATLTSWHGAIGDMGYITLSSDHLLLFDQVTGMNIALQEEN
ncbi:ABC transporter ATP-binding protein [Lacticaseibacillus sp. GG6-2]